MTGGAPGRVPTRCDGCGREDDRGKHHVGTGTVADPQTGEPVLAVISLHFSCCLQRGCPDGTCREALAAEEARLAAS